MSLLYLQLGNAVEQCDVSAIKLKKGHTKKGAAFDIIARKCEKPRHQIVEMDVISHRYLQLIENGGPGTLVTTPIAPTTIRDLDFKEIKLCCKHRKDSFKGLKERSRALDLLVAEYLLENLQAQGKSENKTKFTTLISSFVDARQRRDFTSTGSTIATSTESSVVPHFEDPSVSAERLKKRRKTNRGHSWRVTSNIKTSTLVPEPRSDRGTTQAEGQHFLAEIPDRMDQCAIITPFPEEGHNTQHGDNVDLNSIVNANVSPREADIRERQRIENGGKLTVTVGDGETPCNSNSWPHTRHPEGVLNHVAAQNLQSGRTNYHDSHATLGTGDEEQEASSDDVVGERPRSTHQDYPMPDITNTASVILECSTSTLRGTHTDNNNQPEAKGVTSDISTYPSSVSACGDVSFISYAAQVGSDWDPEVRFAFGLEEN
ncbi:hypothetical protein IQ07DRAFT_638633 [Pyrenochaeta sp. DS3sAY3a]|nr:hypothetical protein IQ07DRAFT_638633 [Pyrenochaeta sp. DS3sAY3a]